MCFADSVENLWLERALYSAARRAVEATPVCHLSRMPEGLGLETRTQDICSCIWSQTINLWLSSFLEYSFHYTLVSDHSVGRICPSLYSMSAMSSGVRECVLLSVISGDVV